MPTSYPEIYFPVLLQVAIAMAIAALMLGISFVLGKRVRNPVKDMPYESGIVPTGDARHRFSVKFYLVGMLFILFDIEAIFLFQSRFQFQAKEDISQDIEPGEERCFLKHHQTFASGRGNGLTIGHDRAGIWFFQACDDV